MGGGKCQLCMKESAAVERTWRGHSRDYPPRGRMMGTEGRRKRRVIQGRGRKLGGPTINCVSSEKISGNLKYRTFFVTNI